MTEQCPAKYLRNVEPSLHELLSDPAARLLMARDGLSEEHVRQLVEATRQRLLGASPSDTTIYSVPEQRR